MSCFGGMHAAVAGCTKNPGHVCACGRARFCNQGWHWAPLAAFGTALKNCRACVLRTRSGGSRASAPRRGLPTSGAPRYLWSERTQNVKLGRIPAVIASGESCPPSCGFYGKGCFAEFNVLGHHWRRAATDGMSFAGLCTRIALLDDGTLWRYAVAGDLPGLGDRLDVRALGKLAHAARRSRGFGFTHKPLERESERAAVRSANELVERTGHGLTVNLSSDSLEHADARADLDVGPVAVVLPSDAAGDLRTPKGRRVVVCPAETRGLTCDACRLCTVPDRRGIVGFRAHGQMKRTVSTIVAGRRLPLLQEAR